MNDIFTLPDECVEFLKSMEAEVLVVNREIGIIGGTGSQGFGLALRWALAGEQVLIGSRDLGKALQAARTMSSILNSDANVEGVRNEEAVARSKIICLTVPFSAHVPMLKSVHGFFKEGDVLIDVTVPLETAFGGKATRVLQPWSGSAAEQAAELVPEGVIVLSAFHHISAGLLRDLTQKIDSDVIVCGNRPDGKEIIKPLVESIPYLRYIDGGPLENSRTVEALTALLISINIRYKVKQSGLRITGLPAQNMK